MKALTHSTASPCPNASQEVLIERAITFRASTFDALKNHMRDHERRTGLKLTNSAAVDLALRSFLAMSDHPGQQRPPIKRPTIGVTMPRLPRIGAAVAPRPQGIDQSNSDTQQPGA